MYLYEFPLIASLDATSPRIGLLRAAARARRHGCVSRPLPAVGAGAHTKAQRARKASLGATCTMQCARRAPEPTAQGSTEAERGAQFLVRIL